MTATGFKPSSSYSFSMPSDYYNPCDNVHVLYNSVYGFTTDANGNYSSSDFAGIATQGGHSVTIGGASATFADGVHGEAAATSFSAPGNCNDGNQLWASYTLTFTGNFTSHHAILNPHIAIVSNCTGSHTITLKVDGVAVASTGVEWVSGEPQTGFVIAPYDAGQGGQTYTYEVDGVTVISGTINPAIEVNSMTEGTPYTATFDCTPTPSPTPSPSPSATPSPAPPGAPGTSDNNPPVPGVPPAPRSGGDSADTGTQAGAPSGAYDGTSNEKVDYQVHSSFRRLFDLLGQVQTSAVGAINKFKFEASFPSGKSDTYTLTLPIGATPRTFIYDWAHFGPLKNWLRQILLIMLAITFIADAISTIKGLFS